MIERTHEKHPYIWKIVLPSFFPLRSIAVNLFITCLSSSCLTDRLWVTAANFDSIRRRYLRNESNTTDVILMQISALMSRNPRNSPFDLFTVSDPTLVGVGGQINYSECMEFEKADFKIVLVTSSFTQRKITSLHRAQRLKIGYFRNLLMSLQISREFAQVCLQDMKFTNFVYGRYSLILIGILHENNLNRSVFERYSPYPQSSDLKGFIMVRSRQNPHTFIVI